MVHRRSRAPFLILALFAIVFGIAWFAPIWFTEDPWPPILILALLAIVYGIAWNATHRGLYLLTTIGLIGLGFVVLIAEELIETESEKVEAQVHALADAVKEGDPETVIAFISTEAGGLRQLIGSRIQDVDVADDLRITDLQVTLESSAEKAKSHFRANGTGTLKQSFSHNFTTRWNLTWQKERETWKVIQIDQLDPIKGDVINEWSSF